MKSYLSLIPISAKIHKSQNRMTILCIIMSVVLVTAIFSVADMMIREKMGEMEGKHGSWHIKLEQLSLDKGEEISQRSDVQAVGWRESFNFDADQPYYIGEKKAAMFGTDPVYMTKLTQSLEEGSFPQRDDQVMLSGNGKDALQVQIGDTVTLSTPAGEESFTVSGFGSDEREYYQGQTFLVAVYMTQTAFEEILEKNGVETSPACYVQFQKASQAAGAIQELYEQHGLLEGSISENTAAMGMSGQSSNQSVKNFYGIAAFLFVLVLLAGVLMISGSMNSNVAQRTKFFGMMRCIGASRQQIIRFVCLEALNWCKTAVPLGLVLGTVLSWAVCGLLHYGIGGEFADVPVWALSPVGLVSGAAVGIVTVLLAARSPARRAAGVSPMAAVSGNTGTFPSVRHRSRLGLGRIQWILGFHHATVSGKNWFLMTASFSLTIIMFLCFSVGLEFAHQLIPSLRSWQPDITLNGYANELVLEPELYRQIEAVPGVGHIFGSSYLPHVPAVSSRQGVEYVNLLSYSDYLLESSGEGLVEGDLSSIFGDSHQAMTVHNKDNPLRVGDIIQIDGKEVRITCEVSEGLYSSEFSVICSPETFTWLTGEENYNLIGVQLDRNATEETVQQLSSFASENRIFADNRQGNQEDATTYLATGFVMYSFLAMIAMITAFHIMNSISMNVTARMKQYGAMRAVGMDGGQLTQMISAEAFTYALSGLVVGCGIGIPLSRFLYQSLLTRYLGLDWKLPLSLLAVIVLFVILFAVAAVLAPAKRLRNMTVTATINELG